MNKLSRSEFIAGVGAEAAGYVAGLLKFLYPEGEQIRVTCRTAPSMEMRSECQLLGVSHPRFVHRIKPKFGGFLDVRRLERMADAVRQFPKRPHYPLAERLLGVAEADHAELDASSMIRSSKPISGALLQPPERFSKSDFHILQVDLGREMGESQEHTGTPFLQFLSFGGGMCAQACISMSCLLQHKWSKNICGVAESTVLAQGEMRLNGFEFRVSGLGGDDVTAVLNSDFIGLSAFREASPHLTEVDGDLVGLAIRSYLLSDVPLIYPCSLRDLKKIVYPQNDIACSHGVSPLNHAVLLVGCAVDDSDSALVLNDPSNYPFLRASREDLGKCLPETHGGQQTESFISVLPGSVCVSLLDEYEDYDSNGVGPLSLRLRQRGLFSVCRQMQHLKSRLVPTDWVEDCLLSSELGQFRLFHVDSIVDNSEAFLAFVGDSDLAVQIRHNAVSRSSFPDWAWIQIRNHGTGHPTAVSCWVWDATIELKRGRIDRTGNGPDPHPSLFFCIGRQQTRELKRFFCRWERAAELPEPVDFGIRVSVLTSYSAKGIRHASNHVPSEVSASELYLFMGNDVAALNVGNQDDDFSAVECLARANSNDALFRRIVKHIVDEWDIVAKQPVAIASYIPQITQDRQTDAGRIALAALEAVGKIGEALREKTGQEKFVCEFVAGSRVDAVWPRGAANEPGFCATVLEDDIALDRVFGALQTVLKGTSPHVRFAAELEPGFLNVIHDLDSLKKFCARIDKYKMGGRVGVNLDCSHFALADILPSEVENSELISSKIMHAHVSGHWDKAHAADLVVSDRYWYDICSWVGLIKRLPRRRPRIFSGFVTIEIEACATEKYVDLSLKNLRKLFARVD